jgi:hypothetical protein
MRGQQRSVAVRPNPSFHPMCYGWLRQSSRAGELKRRASLVRLGSAIASLVISVGAAHGADNARPNGVNCTLQLPPTEAGELSIDGTIVRVFPRAKDIDARYSGCQAVFMEQVDKWEVAFLTEVVEGDPVRVWSEHAPSNHPVFLCRYKNGKVTVGDPDNCPTPKGLLVKSLPPGCIRLIRDSHAKPGTKASRPASCLSE